MNQLNAVPSLRTDLDLIPRYVAGRRPGRATGWKLSSNEAADPPAPTVTNAAASALAAANRYPDPAASPLADRLATHLQVPRDHLVTGAGSIAVLQEILQAATDPGDPVVFAWRSYEAYPIVTRVTRAQPVTVPLLPDGRHDLAAMASAVRNRHAKVVIVCNPNNPTGSVVDPDRLEQFVATAPSDCLIVIDEAYREFMAPRCAPDSLRLVSQHPNVVILRTFSKAHALAGLRVGYAVAASRVAEAIEAVALPFTVSAVAQAAAIAALDGWQQQAPRVTDLTARRDRFIQALRDAGLQVTDSQANFVWLPRQPGLAQLVDQMLSQGITTREFDDGVRITVAEPAAMRAITRLLTMQAAR